MDGMGLHGSGSSSQRGEERIEDDEDDNGRMEWIVQNSCHNFNSIFSLSPKGFPTSVTPDYVTFQIWDSLQGRSTYICTMLSTQALLSAIGVGEKSATVIGVMFQWFLRDFTGMLGGILFTFYQGSSLDSNAKMWRLVSDLMNDLGDTLGSFIYVPCEVMKQRMQVQGTKSSWSSSAVKGTVCQKSGSQMYAYYTGMFQAGGSIFREQGLRGLYAGYWSTLARDIPFTGLMVTFYETLYIIIPQMVQTIWATDER